METEFSLPHLRDTAIGPCPKPFDSSPQPHTLFLYDTSEYYTSVYI